MKAFRNFLSSAHLFILVSIAFSIALISYLMLRTYHVRLDFSQGQVYSLSVQSIKILESLKDEPIEIIGFFRENHALKRQLEELLKEYAYHHRKLKYRFYDPDRMPAKTKQYGIEAYETLVIEVKGRREKTNRISEEAITNLLAKLYREETKKIFFTTGHGEASLEDAKNQAGYGLLREKLQDANYDVREIVLAREGISKNQADLLILGGPKVDLLPREIDMIRSYLTSGGRVLILMDPVDSSEGKNLEAFVREYGIELGENVIVDKLSKLFGADYLIPLITEYHLHEITKGFQLASFFPVARTVRKIEGAWEELNRTELAWTGAGSWAETDLKKLEEGVATFYEDQDIKGPLPVATAVSPKEAEWRLVVVGDSEFSGNAYLNLSGNKDFILNICAWLTGDEFAISVRPRERAATPLFLKETDQEYLLYVPVMGPPIMFLMTGTGVFFWRRKYR